ncbi:MAG: pyridine nucleotide-disulfide oxidoreductase [Erysipelotrichia bacterium]|nr:pyridine nucleotide-disulfide oxidoreductase [Erysipelotrichia bacterium]
MKYDALIIGFGKAGKTLAGAFAKQGKKVALVEKDSNMYGGTCINVGCIPSKSLVTGAAEASLHPEYDFDAKKEHYRLAVEEKRRVTGMLRKKNYDKLNTLENAAIYDGTAHFVSAKEVEVKLADGSSLALAADKIYINTGSASALPSISGIENNPHVYTSTTLMNEENLPKQLTLIGAGYIGMEFASMYASYGSKVTILTRDSEFLPREDRDVADAIQKIMEARGITIVLNAKIENVENDTVNYSTPESISSIKSDAILIAAGRIPNIKDLQLENAGIELNLRGAIKVNEHLETSVPGVYALGDVNGGLQFTYVSLDDSRIILSDGAYTLNHRQAVPYSVFMDTPLSRVGISEKEANEKNIPYRLVKLPTAAIPKAQVLRKTDGFLKALISPDTGEILGAALLCPESYEMINLIKLAMDMHADYTVLRDRIYTHPTMTEAFNDLFSL